MAATKINIAQSLECPVCLNIFKDPKILPCSHTFCKACLDNLLGCHGNEQNLRCPVCRADTQVLNHDVSQLPTNLALKSLIDDVENQHQVCTNCKSEEKPKAVVYCKDCGKYLCISCQTTHSQWDGFSDHEVSRMSEIASGKVSVRKYRKCKKHSREDEECFCSDCRIFACFRCGVMEHAHQGHRILEASAYESNHLKGVKDLKAKADKKQSSIQKYIDFIDKQRNLVSTAKKQCIDGINEAYEESVKQFTEKKDLLIDEVNVRTSEADAELNTMKTDAQQQIAHMITVTDLVTNGTKIPLEMDALAAHDTLCQELQNALTVEDPDFKRPSKSSKKGKHIVFEREVDVGELGLGKLVDSVVRNIALPTEDSMNGMACMSDCMMAVGCYSGGIEIFSSNGQLHQTVLKDIRVHEVGFLSDGRCVLRNDNNNITLYTTEWEELDVRFETLNHEDGEFGDLDVDSDDQIYVSDSEAEKIQVFSPEGGKAIREISCNVSPVQITTLQDGLLVTDRSDTISIINNDGNVKYMVTHTQSNTYPTVTQDNRILVASVNHDEGLVSIDEYTKELQHIKTLISDYKIEKSERGWYYLKEFRSGEMAFCTPDRLYIFNLEL